MNVLVIALDASGRVALATFAADTIVIAAHYERSGDLAREVAADARKRFHLPTLAGDEPLPRAA